MSTNGAASVLPLTQSTSLRQQIQWVIRLSVPAVLAELSSTAMQYIDAAMVGSLGGDATAAVGLMTSSTWLFNGLCASLAVGFSVQVAHLIGAGQVDRAREVLRQSLMGAVVFSLLLGVIAVAVSPFLPVWLGGEAKVCPDSSRYFFVFGCGLPALQMCRLGSNVLQCSGDMRTPSALNMLMCLLDVIFNALLIFPTREVAVCGMRFTVVGAGMGVAGAALGTVLAEVVVAVLMLYALCLRSPVMRLERGRPWRFDRSCQMTAARLGLPMALERAVINGAQIVSTGIVASLGTVPVAANSLAVTAESLCYMPGFGVGAAATTLVGQSVGAGRRDLARRYANLSVALGMLSMGAAGALMYLGAPWMLAMMTPDPAIRELGARVLRIEAFAEPLFGASLVGAGALRGAGDTLVPSVMNLVSIWGVRISAALCLAPRMGLEGVWLAMCGELCFRGILFLVRLARGKWLDKTVLTKGEM